MSRKIHTVRNTMGVNYTCDGSPCVNHSALSALPDGMRASSTLHLSMQTSSGAACYFFEGDLLLLVDGTCPQYVSVAPRN